MSDNSRVSPNTFLLASGCISALIVTFVGIIGFLIFRSIYTLITAAVLFWAVLAFRVAWHWDDEGWTRVTRGAMLNSFVASLAAWTTGTIIIGLAGSGWSQRDWLIHLAVVPTVAAAELIGFFIGRWTHRHRLRAQSRQSDSR